MLTPGIYILTCLATCGYDDGLFWWKKGQQYRLQIKEDGMIIFEAEGLLFAPTQEMLEHMLEFFEVEADLYNNRDVYQYFFQKKVEGSN